MRKGSNYSPFVLFITGTLVFSAGVLMQSFPILLFAGLAPLFAITDHAKKENAWNKTELIGFSTAVALCLWTWFNQGSFVMAFVQSILIALIFLVFTFSRSVLGPKLGKLPLILFWLSLEYLLLRFDDGNHFIFLADFLLMRTEWLNWTHYTGYLGSSFWILAANFILYRGLFKEGIQWPYLLVFFIVIAGPIVYSYSILADGISRGEMISLYHGMPGEYNPSYKDTGEWISRTATWISTLILLYVVVRKKTGKK